jgi:hypothetical protein
VKNKNKSRIKNTKTDLKKLPLTPDTEITINNKCKGLK